MYAEPYILTKIDVAALRQATELAIHLDGDVGRFRAIKRQRATVKQPYGGEIEHRIPAPITLGTYHRQEAGNVQCFAYLSLYQSQKTPQTSIINTLRAGDGIRLRFHADYRQTKAMRDRTAFHADTLILEVYRAGKLRATWELANVTCEDNTARMVQGVYERREETVAA